MRRLTYLATVLSLLLVSTTWSQELAKRITNKDIIDMTAIGLSDDLIIAKIRSASTGGTLQFDTSLPGLKELKASNVTVPVIFLTANLEETSKVHGLEMDFQSWLVFYDTWLSS